MSIKTTITLEHGNRTHRDRFLKDLRMLLLRWGGKAPKVKIRVVLETEAEHGLPDDISLLELGIEPEEGPVATLTPLDTALAEAFNTASRNTLSEPESEGEPTEDTARPPSTAERILQALAAHGPMSESSLASRLFLAEAEVAAATSLLHAQGDIEPDDGGVWRLSERE